MKCVCTCYFVYVPMIGKSDICMAPDAKYCPEFLEIVLTESRRKSRRRACSSAPHTRSSSSRTFSLDSSSPSSASLFVLKELTGIVFSSVDL